VIRRNRSSQTSPRRRRGSWIAFVLLAAMLCLPAGAQASFGFENVGVSFLEEDGSAATQAGSHPYSMTTTIQMNTVPGPEGKEVPDGNAKSIVVDLPAGVVGDPTAAPRCPDADFVVVLINSYSPCPNDTAVGLIKLRLGPNEGGPPQDFPLYNLAPDPGSVAKLGFLGFGVPVAMDVDVRDRAPYNVVASLDNISQAVNFHGSEVVLWGSPADPSHDDERGRCLFNEIGPAPESDCSVAPPQRPFLTMPRSCRGPLTATFAGTSWQEPKQVVSETAVATAMTGCDKLKFGPRIAAAPTTDRAESSSGLDFNLEAGDEGLTDLDGTAHSDIEKTVVTLPPGVTVNPSMANGLAACSKAEYERETLGSEPGQACPEAAKVGNVEVETPLLEGALLKGSLYVAQPDDPATAAPGAENPFDSLLAIYMVIRDPKLGILVKLPGKVVPDERTGQLVTTFGEAGQEIPQFPFAHFRFHFRDGARSPLITPPACGRYAIVADFTPWADPGSTVTANSPFGIDAGPNGGPCPAAPSPFSPGFQAGSINNNAGSYSPFEMRLTRSDSEQEMTRFSALLPPGVLAKLAGVAKCSEAGIAAAKARSGRQELAAPSCPAGSEIGRTLAGAGVGSTLTYVPGTLYLAGPFAGHPLSVVAVTPAVAGPFDVGTVVVREALDLDPNTAEVQVDGAASDPIPHILRGIPLKLRDLRVNVDRPSFTVNPTSCDPSAARAILYGSYLDVFSPADDAAVSLTDRYQAASCSSLAFKPKLSLKLKGGTRRGDHPALRAVVRPRAGDANIGRTVVALPHSAFLEQAHIRTVCTRAQFAVGACPAGSVYGRARAFTPLLDEPLEGPVYLRSSDHPLPDLVVALHGVVDINLVGRIDSVHSRLRTSFESVPDAPVSKFVLRMQGGRKSLIVNSRNLCGGTQRATARFAGQNGKAYDTKPTLANSCRKHAKKHSPHKR
jgi:hypothetical protein